MYFPFICGISIFPVFFYWCFFYVFLYITHPCSTRGGVEREWGLVVTELQQVHLIWLISPVGVDLSWYEFSQSLSGQRQTLYKNTCNHTNTTQKCMCQDHHHTSKYKKNFPSQSIGTWQVSHFMYWNSKTFLRCLYKHILKTLLSLNW